MAILQAATEYEYNNRTLGAKGHTMPNTFYCHFLYILKNHIQALRFLNLWQDLTIWHFSFISLCSPY